MMKRGFRWVEGAARVVVLPLLVGASGCGGDDMPSNDAGGGGACLDPLPACDTNWPATYDDIYTRVIAGSCGAATPGACHGEGRGESGLFLYEREEAYEALTGERNGKVLVVPGSPECSELMQRLESNVVGFAMPPGGQLTPAERCAIAEWIGDGAPR